MKKQSQSKNIWNVCHLSLLTFTTTLLLASKIFANEASPDPFTKINAVSELAEIQSTDWAFQSLKSLMDRYGVVAGHANKTFGGNQAMTRDEFATSLAVIMNRINELTSANANQVYQEDLETLKRLQAEFGKELGILQERLDSVETRINSTQPFSTTTKLEGEVLFAVSGVSSGKKADDSGDTIDSNLTLSSRTRLTFDTSFTGKDRLKIRLQASNLPRIDDATETDMARLAFQGNSDNQFELSVFEYRFPIGQAVVYVEAEGGDLDDFTDTLNPFFSGSGRGSISRFAQRNPIYRQGGGAGAGLVYDFSDSISLSLGYVADDVDDPEVGFGKAEYGAIAQLNLEPSDSLKVGLTYIHSYNSLDTGTGSRRANDPFDDESDAIIADSFGLQSTFAINDGLTVSGWVGFTHAMAMDLPNNPEANIFNWAVTLAFVDLGGENSVGGIAIGQPPKVTSNDFEVANQLYEDEDTSLHLEAFYRFQVDDHIAITPGLLMITNPEHDRQNDTIYIGTIRTTFSF
ncbi:carbohydrate porin [Komarekiella sp. 'clone 1']|uniref:Carbohydrate porin n=1 Tax=Komarekiella delphini-convector SJRDD-AB1 TaxID=2593771 RepID=A0AA40SWL9_9NOST|nr:iron uptake porin [Komarekiella delphini-convector]MBD6616315.1 carbohydrate porin [Komarekiella delphini-convector SJRDD-AB1]